MEKPAGSPPPTSEKKPPRQRMPGSAFVVLALVVLGVIFLVPKLGYVSRSEVPYGLFRTELAQENVRRAAMKGMKIYGEFKDPPLVVGGKTDRNGNPERYENEFVTV